MTQARPAVPPDARYAHASADDLDERIERLERRIVARRQHLVEQAHVAGERVQYALQPRRVLPPVLAASLGAAALWALLRRNRPRHGVEPSIRRMHRPVAGASDRWSRLIEIGRPIVGARLGLGANPTLATILLSASLPLLRRLLDGAAARRAEPQRGSQPPAGAETRGTSARVLEIGRRT